MGIPDLRELARFLIRLSAAILFGALVGYERERKGKAAGLRTHMLVALGSALMVVASQQFGMSSEGLSRVVQGIVTGIGFVGAGAVLKMRDDRQIEGLTTAASIWLTSGIGISVGLGGLGLGMASTVFSLIILAFLLPVERAVGKSTHAEKG